MFEVKGAMMGKTLGGSLARTRHSQGKASVAGPGEVLHAEAGVVARREPLLCSSVSDKGGENLFYTLL